MADHRACGRTGPDCNAFRRISPPYRCAHPNAHTHHNAASNGDDDLYDNRGCYTHSRCHPDSDNGSGGNLNADSNCDPHCDPNDYIRLHYDSHPA